MFKRLIIAIVVLGLVVGGIVWFKFFRDGMMAQFLSGMVPAPVPVTAETVEAVTWEPGIDAIGTALAAHGVDLAIESGGLVQEILFAPNDSVSEGQPLVQIKDDSERAALAAALAALAVAQADLSRTQTLSERGVGAANTVETAEAQSESARAEVTRVQTALDSKRVIAPFAGIIGIPQVEVGQYVTVGTIYATLQDIGQMRVDFTVPEQQMSALELGREITAATEVGDLSAKGRIIAIEPRVDPNSRLITVRAEVDNPSGKLYPGQFLRVRVALPAEQGVIALPQTAVSSTLYGDSVFVVKPGEATGELVVDQVFVKLGRRSGARIEVIEGIEPGQRVVTSGQNRLTDGAKVTIDDSVTLDAPAAD